MPMKMTVLKGQSSSIRGVQIGHRYTGAGVTVSGHPSDHDRRGHNFETPFEWGMVMKSPVIFHQMPQF